MRDEAARASRQQQRAILEVSRWRGSDVHGSPVMKRRRLKHEDFYIPRVRTRSINCNRYPNFDILHSDVKSKDCANNSSREYSQAFRNILLVGFD